MKASVAIVLCAAAFAAGWLLAPRDVSSARVSAPVVTVVRDTVRITEPRYVRSVEVRTVEVEVPVQAGADTAVVALPIESREFCGDDYRAWVSGWQPSLDSLVITRTLARTEYTVSPTAKPRRWSIGLQAGVGLTPGGVQPYVGVGLSYRLTP